MSTWRNIANDKEKYQAYLCSREWGVLKEQVRERASNKCERCLMFPMNAVHHLTYVRKYNEALEDLQAICTSCHEFTHGKSDVDPCTFTMGLEVWPGNPKREGTSCICCPICGSDDVHLGRYSCDTSKYWWSGPLHIFSCRCELEHEFELCLVAHEGNMLAYTRNHRRSEPLDISSLGNEKGV
jgi:hypothetical protein